MLNQDVKPVLLLPWVDLINSVAPYADLLCHRPNFGEAKVINLVADNNIKMPNCTDNSWNVDNIKAKDMRMIITEGHIITHDLEYIQEKFGFSEEDMLSVPQNTFKYARETFKD